MPRKNAIHAKAGFLWTYEAARMLKLSVRRVQTLIKDGVLKGHKVKGSWQVNLSSVEAYRKG